MPVERIARNADCGCGLLDGEREPWRSRPTCLSRNRHRGTPIDPGQPAMSTRRSVARSPRPNLACELAVRMSCKRLASAGGSPAETRRARANACTSSSSKASAPPSRRTTGSCPRLARSRTHLVARPSRAAASTTSRRRQCSASRSPSRKAFVSSAVMRGASCSTTRSTNCSRGCGGWRAAQSRRRFKSAMSPGSGWTFMARPRQPAAAGRHLPVADWSGNSHRIESPHGSIEALADQTMLRSESCGPRENVREREGRSRAAMLV